jgi:putative heme-binding domain-containing protein
LTYQADAYPGFRGRHIAANILSNVLYWYDVEPIGSTFTTRLGGELLEAHDEWFRPVDLTVGPDGCVYIADWYDVRATHNNTREDTWDKTSGRIYRMDYGPRRPIPGFNLSQEPSAALVERLRDPNEWFHREARRVLAERRDTSIIPRLRESIFSASTDHDALEFLWALYVSGGFDEALARRLLEHPRSPVRRWAVRFLGDSRKVEAGTLEALAALAARESDPHVRSQLASSSRRLSGEQALKLLTALIRKNEDSDDRHIPLLLWWAVEQNVKDKQAPFVDLLSSADAWRARLPREHLIQRLARRLASAGSESELSGCARLLASAPDRQSADIVLSGIEAGLAGRAFEKPPAHLGPVLDAIWNRGSPTPLLERVAARLGNSRSLARVRAAALAERHPRAERIAAIELLGQIRRSDSLRALEQIAARKEPEEILIAVVNALGRFPDASIADVLLRRSAAFEPRLRERTYDLLTTRKEWTEKLVAHLGEEFRNQPAVRVQRILQHDDPELRAQVERAWGRMTPSGSPEKSERARLLAGIVGPPDLFTRPGRRFDKERGRNLYDERCARCHTLFGKGGTIGPDLTGAERRNIDTLMLAVVDPSAAIRKEYASFLLRLRDGRMLSGVIQDPTPESFVVVDAQGEKTIVARREVVELKESQTSLMPEGLLDDLDSQGLVDLFSYLTAR